MSPPTATATIRRLRIPRRLGPYRVCGHLSKGGMNYVMRAEHQVLEREVALKVLPPQEREGSPKYLRFAAEARAGAQVAHPNVATCFDAGTDRSWHYLAIEFVRGGDLRQQVRRRSGPLPERMAVALIKDVAKGLAAVHAAGLIHRDIKPANVLLSRRMMPKLADFGIAIAKGSPVERGWLMGSPAYMAPEQLDQDPVDERTDVYLLAGTLYHLVVGEPPFRRKPDDLCRVKMTRVAPLAHLRRSEVSRELSLVLHKAMAEDPDRRHPTAWSFGDALDDLLHNSAGNPAQPVYGWSPSLPLLSQGQLMGARF